MNANRYKANYADCSPAITSHKKSNLKVVPTGIGVNIQSFSCKKRFVYNFNPFIPLCLSPKPINEVSGKLIL